MSSPQSYKRFQDQNYEQIKAECLKTNSLFADNKFPADNTSLFKFNETFNWQSESLYNSFFCGQMLYAIKNYKTH